MELFKLLGTIAVNGAEESKKEISSVTDHAEKTGSSLVASLGKVGSVALKIGTVAATAVAGLVASIGKTSVENYAVYEQLVGGVETLFKDSSAKVLEYANNAYKTAGLSANDYMTTVTSFSASLLQSLGGDTEKAADKANQALVDMADNANKMGTAMGSIQDAYQGFAKQNYTMLDNLKLGYGGTKTEMERLLADATKISGVKYDVSSYADIVDAIHVVQTELGITGTTALEASTTISGSIASMKSAWSNFVAGLSNPDADLPTLMKNVVDSAVTAIGDNILPTVMNLLPRLTEGITQLMAAFLPYIAPTVKQILPPFIAAIVAFLPEVAKAGLEILMTIVNSIVDALPDIIEAGVEIVLSLIDSLTDPDQLDNLIDAALKIIIAIASGLITAIPKLIEKVPEIITKLIDAIIRNLPKLVDTGMQLLNSLVTGVINTIPKIWQAGINVVQKFISAAGSILGQLPSIGRNIVEGVWRGISNAASNFYQNVKSFFSNIVDSVKNVLGIHSPSKVFAGIGGFMAAGLGEGWDNQFDTIKKDINDSLVFDDAAVNISANESLNRSGILNASGGAQNPIGNNSQPIILNVVSPDGKELARFVAPYMGAQLQLARG